MVYEHHCMTTRMRELEAITRKELGVFDPSPYQTLKYVGMMIDHHEDLIEERVVFDTKWCADVELFSKALRQVHRDIPLTHPQYTDTFEYLRQGALLYGVDFAEMVRPS